jgi:glycosyltransferase involved in cell wall biosynthesis
MRVAILTECARGHGASEAAWNLASALQGAGHEVAYLFAEESTDAVAEFPGAFRVGSWQRANRAIAQMRRLPPGSRRWLDNHLIRREEFAELRTNTIEHLTAFRPDIVHVHNAGAIGGHVLVASLARRWPTAWTAHDRYPFQLFHNTWEIRDETFTTWEYSPSEQPATVALEMFRSMDDQVQFLTPSRWLADIAIEALDGSTHRVDVVPNLIPEHDAQVKISLAQRLGVESVALSVIPSPTYPLKGFDVVRAAVAQARTRLGDDKLALAIVTAEDLGLIGESIYTLIDLRRMGIIESKGYLNKTEMAELYAASDVLMVSSWIENLPNVVIEAASKGRPAIGTSVGGVPEVVRPGETGWLVPVGDPARMADALVEAASDPETRKHFGAGARSHYLATHRPQVVIDRHIEIYARAIGAMALRRSAFPQLSPHPSLDFSEVAFAPRKIPRFGRWRKAIRLQRRVIGRCRRWYSQVLGAGRS